MLILGRDPRTNSVPAIRKAIAAWGMRFDGCADLVQMIAPGYGLWQKSDASHAPDEESYKLFSTSNVFRCKPNMIHQTSGQDDKRPINKAPLALVAILKNGNVNRKYFRNPCIWIEFQDEVNARVER